MKKTFHIIDAHMHLPAEPASLEEKKAQLLAEMRNNGIGKGIVISDSELESCIGSLTECARLFADCPDIAVVGGISPYIDFDRQLEQLENFIVQRMVVGIKLYCGHEPVYLNDACLEPVYRLAAENNVPVLFHSGWDNPQFSAPEIVRQAACAHRKIRFVCCHCCYPRLGDCFDILEGCPNIYFDLSSVADGNRREFIPILERAVRSMPERFIFGSDFGCCDQGEHLRFFRQLDLSEHEARLVMHGNAMRIYGFE